MFTFKIRRITEAHVPLPEFTAYLLQGGLPRRLPNVIVPAYQVGQPIQMAGDISHRTRDHEGEIGVIAEVLPHDEDEHGDRRAYLVRWAHPAMGYVQEIRLREDQISHAVPPAGYANHDGY